MRVGAASSHAAARRASSWPSPLLVSQPISSEGGEARSCCTICLLIMMWAARARACSDRTLG